jgi:alginate O-acetyltransferase complex protein AlgJ
MSTAIQPHRIHAGLDRAGPQAEEAPEVLARVDLNRGILPTAVSPWLARAMTALFLAAVFAVPAAQVAADLARKRGVQALEVFTRFPSPANLHGYEKELETQSAARALVQPHLQLLLSSYQGFGNPEAILGRGGWLFYRPGVDFLTGPGLLDGTRLRLRRRELIEAGEKNPSPDPSPAILAFHEDCRKAGVHLVVVPVPDKAMLQPAELTARLAFSAPVAAPANPDYPRFLQGLRAAGVDVFEPTPAQLVPGEPARFLQQDTHWTPAWMEEVARTLATHLRTRVPLPPGGERPLAVGEVQVSRVGDVVDMLKLPAGQALFVPQTVTIRQVRDPASGAAWQPRADADVLLLGDSFSNIYGAADLGWGEGAGFPAQLARFLGRGVDVIARNGSGATGTRRELAHRPAPLDGKRVVIWEFAVRELTAANWEVIPLPAPPTTGGGVRRAGAAGAAPLRIVGTVVAASRVPQPRTVPYKDCLTYIKLRVDQVVEGNYGEGHLIAVFWGMRDNVLLPPAHYALGKRLRLQVVPFRQATGDLQAVRTADDLDDYDHPPYLVLEEQGL